jgi:hypothetical protein
MSSQPGRTGAPLLIVAMALLAGCAGLPGGNDGGDTTPAMDVSWAERVLSPPSDHNHSIMAHHRGLSTPNFEVLGHDPMISFERGSTNYYFPCGDAKETVTGRRIAVVESESDVAFGLADITDPMAPVFLGEMVMRTSAPYDVAVVPDGRHIVMVTELPKSPEQGGEPLDAPMGPTWRSACDPTPRPLIGRAGPAEELLPHGNQLLLISIEDPRNPVIVDQRPLSGVGHGVSTELIDGRTWVGVAAWGQYELTSTYQFYEITTTAAGPVLGYLSTFNIPPSPDAQLRSLGHDDVWITKHPKTGDVTAWMAHWHHGLIIVDLSDPRMPRQLGQWSAYDPARPAATGGMHSLWIAPELRDGRHIVVTGPELGGRPTDQPSGTVYVVDTTDPTNPTPIAGWTLPHDVQWTKGGEWSGHYLTVINDTGFITMYHGGIWAFDLSKISDTFTSLPSVGVFVPDLESPSPDIMASPWAPMLGEVHAFSDGTMVTFEATAGVITFRYNETEPMPAPEPWPIPKPIGAK